MIGEDLTEVGVPKESPRSVFILKFSLFVEAYLKIENHTILV